MGLFSNRRNSKQIDQEPVAGPVDAHSPTASPTATSGGLFKRNTLTKSPNSPTSGPHDNQLANGGQGSAIHAARERLQIAINAEREALAALERCRTAVSEAKRHVALVEAESIAEHKAAEAKMKEAKAMRKQTAHMGKI